MKNLFFRLFIYILTAASLLLLNSCAGIRLKAIPSPPSTSKLRVYIQPISAPFPYPAGAGLWNSFHNEFAARQIDGIGRFLKQTGIYEVVPASDVEEVLGGHDLTYLEVVKNGCMLARQIGKALYAEYTIIIERRLEPNKLTENDYYFTIIIINNSTGKQFEASERLDKFERSSRESMIAIIKKLYRTVFLSAKNDMFGIAIRKSEKMHTPKKEIAAATAPEPASEVIPQAQPAIPEQPVTPLEPKLIVASPEPIPPVIPQASEVIPQAPPQVQEKTVTPPEPKLIAAAPEPEPAKPVDTVTVKPGHEEISGTTRLVIYDLEAPEQYRTVALIMTEVLREELFLLNRFILVNREDLLDVLHEMALQQKGLIDEKQAVKAGKGLAANQIVTGSLRILGKTYLLNAKRIDVETFATLGIASTRFAKGEEEDVLSRLPGLAKSLAGVR
ncbi:MAG: hypothetical protein KKF00_04345 [Proteobacteria bacterium]|nr:hypothetical protein [Pseudomonadota bacterium]